MFNISNLFSHQGDLNLNCKSLLGRQWLPCHFKEILRRLDAIFGGERGETNDSVMKACLGQMMTGEGKHIPVREQAVKSSPCFIYRIDFICFCVGQM